MDCPANIIEFLKTIAANHRGCEDGWYACPLSEDYLDGTRNQTECQCWAGDAQKLLDELAAPRK